MHSEDKNTARENRFDVSRHSWNPVLTALAFATALIPNWQKCCLVGPT